MVHLSLDPSATLLSQAPTLIALSGYLAAVVGYWSQKRRTIKIDSFTGINPGWVLLTGVVSTVIASLFSPIWTFLLLVVVGLFVGTVIGERLTFTSRRRSLIYALEDFPDPLHLIFLGAIAGLAVVVRYPGLAEIGRTLQEHHHLLAARTYLEASDFPFRTFFYRPGSEVYDRAWIYTVQVAEVFRLLGVRAAFGRLVSLAWGVLLLVPTYMMAKQLDFSRARTLVVLWWVSVSSFLVTLSRWLRMDSMFVTVFLFWMVCVYKFLTDEDRSSRRIYGLFGLLLGALSLHLHWGTLTVLPGIFVFWYSIQDGETRKWTRVGLLLALLLLGVVCLINEWSFLALTDQFVFNPLYVSFLVHEPFGWLLGGLFLGVGTLTGFERKPRRYILTVTGLTLGFFVFFAKGSPAYQSVSHLIILAYFPIAWGVFDVLDRFFHHDLRWRIGLFGLFGVVMPAWELLLWYPELWNGSMGSLYSNLRILKFLS